ncbi:MAG: sugar phosphate isomerase/epimerase [Lentisphaeraceae bacterium]|nr:sugar phosphate isomerase/epimerase [Lentisphaeraceae bacterium]
MRLFVNRRLFCSGLATLPFASCMTSEPKDFKIGVCDWNIRSMGVPEAFSKTKEIGLDGIQLSYVPRHQDYDLRQKSVQQMYLQQAKKNNIEIASMAMGIFNKRPFSTDEDSAIWADECLDIMLGMNQKLVLFAFFGKGDIKGKPELQKKVISRLKALMPKAEKHGLTIGLETWLNQEEHMRILDAVGSESVKVYYDTANMEKMGYDIYKEIRWLGKKDAICQIHMKENGFLLGQGKVDFPRVKEALADINYQDWLVMESAIKGDMIVSYKHNAQYLRTLFNK